MKKKKHTIEFESDLAEYITYVLGGDLFVEPVRKKKRRKKRHKKKSKKRRVTKTRKPQLRGVKITRPGALEGIEKLDFKVSRGERLSMNEYIDDVFLDESDMDISQEDESGMEF